MQDDIGREMTQHGAFQSVFPVQPTKSNAQQSVQDDGTRDYQKVHWQSLFELWREGDPEPKSTAARMLAVQKIMAG